MKDIDFFLIPLVFFLILLGMFVYLSDIPREVTRDPVMRNELVLAMSQFEVIIGEDGEQEYKAGDARVWIVHPDEDWRTEILINEDSNVAHKGMIGDLDEDGLNELYVAGGQNASLKVYRKTSEGWEDEVIWKPNFVRVRDIEIGDVDGDNKPELVAGTHRDGVVAVIEWNGSWIITEIIQKDDRFIHEMETADINGDGIEEFFSNPTDPNIRKGLPQNGSVMMHSWNGSEYLSTFIEEFNDTHCKEFTVGDVDNDGENEVIAAVFGTAEEINQSAQDIQDGIIEMVIKIPLRIVMWDFENGEITREVIAEIDDIKARSMRVGDADNDGKNELLVGSDVRGLWVIQKEGEWEKELIDNKLKGNIHEILIIDIDNDGKNEIIANADEMGIVNLYRKTASGWENQTIIDGIDDYWIWAMDFGDVDNE